MNDPPRGSPTPIQRLRRPGNSQAKKLSIGQLAQEFDITTRTIRFYEARGLMHPDRQGLARTFGPADRRRLALIVRAKNLGLTLDEIAEQLQVLDLGCAEIGELEALRTKVNHQLTRLAAKRSALSATMNELRLVKSEIQKRLAKPLKAGS
jgi:DNA-binding transcriptional MerR regulator